MKLRGNEIVLLWDKNCAFHICNGKRKSMNANIPKNINRLMDLYSSFGSRQLIEKPDREAISTSTLIDHISVNNDNNTIESGVLKLGFCNHYLLYTIKKFCGNISKVCKNMSDEKR